jgi:putative methionine-R-sulfoxide reductase with GAF domain/GGDEF domain-containing protein
MTKKTQHIAIIGGNKQGLGLLPTLLQDKRTKIACIVDPNPNAMLFKVEEMGYKLADQHGIQITDDLNVLKTFPKLDFIINCLEDPTINNFLRQPEFVNVEKLSPLSVRLLWSLRTTGATAVESEMDQVSLLSSMREIVDAVKLTADRRELLSVILTLAIESTRAERGSLMLVNEDDGTLRVEVARGMDNEVVRKIRLPIGEGISGKVAKSGKPLLISGKASEKEFKHIRERSDVKSAICVPLIAESHVIGVVNVNSSESLHAFTEVDLNFLASLANLAAEVIYRSEELDKMKGTDAKFNLWKNINTIMSSRDSLEKMLNDICGVMADFLGGVTSFIYLYNDDDKSLALKASTVKGIAGLGSYVLHGGEGIEGWVADNRKRVVLVDREIVVGSSKMYMALPMLTAGRFIGVLSVEVVSQNEDISYLEPILNELTTFLAENIYRRKLHEESILRSNRILAVDETGLELLSISDPNKFYNIVAVTMAAIIGAEGSTIRTRYEGGNRFKLRGAYNLDDNKIREYFLPIEKETLQEVIGTKAPICKEIPKDESPYIKSILSHPLMMDGNIVAGIVTLFNKSSEDTIFASNFSMVDMEVLKRFVVYIEKAMAMLVSKDVKQMEYEFLTTREFLEKRTSEEISRGKRHGKRFLLLTIRIPGLSILSKYEGERIVQDVLDFVRGRIRDFDVVAKLDEERMAILFLESDEKALRVLEDIIKSVGTDNIFSKLCLDKEGEFGYGYAIFPEDGSTFEELLEKTLRRTNIQITKDENRLV